jgi:hypothetical protein
MCRQQDLFGLFQCLYPFMTSFICMSGKASLPIRFAFRCAGIVGLIKIFFLFWAAAPSCRCCRRRSSGYAKTT